jgi:hypothetical protein
VTGELEDGVGRRVEDRAAGRDVLGAELVDDAGARGRLVAQDATADDGFERLDDLGREAVRIGRERVLEDESHHLPVSGGRVAFGASTAPEGRVVGPDRAGSDGFARRSAGGQ